MLAGPLEGTVEILKTLKSDGRYQLLALTNWSAETFPIALKKYEFLGWFEGIVMSGEEKTRKPFKEFYDILIKRYQLDPSKCLFIDDSLRNIEGGLAVGLSGIHFRDPEELRQSLQSRGILK